MKKALLLSIVICLTAVVAQDVLHAQSKVGQGGVQFLVGFPSGEFKDELDKTAFGFGIDALYAPHGFGIGIAFGYLQYGSTTRNVPFSLTIPDVRVDVTTSNGIALFDLLLRLNTLKGDVKPYIDALVGLSYIFTTTSIDDEDYDDDHEIASSTNKDDIAFNYGAGAGILIKITTIQDGDSEQYVYIDLGARYLFGGEAEYNYPGIIERPDGSIDYDERKSRTDLIQARIGVLIEF
ncbi:MAG: hypothetical protein CL946_02515 [Ectothiorhodospiraceae bacterium]|nr:hypothetical protein [Ectothiorhodospiraceae bacterium]